MSLRSVIDIDVNAPEWKRFVDEYNAHRKAVKELPGDWAKVAKVTTEVGGQFSDMTAALMAQAKLIAEQREEREKQWREEDKRERQEQAAARERIRLAKEQSRIEKEASDRRNAAVKAFKDEVKSIAGFAGDFAKWAGLSGLGALWGIGSLAGNISGTYRTAQGIGVSSGQLQAAGVNYGRFFDTGSTLSNIANAQSDLSKRWAFSSMGLNPNGQNPAALMAQMAPAAKRMFEAGGMTQQYAEATGLTQFFTMEDLRRLHASSYADLASARKGFGQDSRDLGLSDATQQEWQKFHYALDRAGVSIKTTLADGLAPLLPALKGFTDEVAKAIRIFLSNPKLKTWMDQLGHGLENFARLVGTDKFQHDVATFVTDFALIAEKLAGVIRFFGGDSTAAAGVAGTMAQLKSVPVDARIGANGVASAGILRAAQASGVSAGILNGIYGVESGFGAHTGPSRAGALGPFQFMPGTAAQYGIDPMNFDQAAGAAGKFLLALFRHYRGDMDKALAAYNWGQGNLDRDIKAHPLDWLSHAPTETQNYVKKVKLIASITMNNMTGSGIATQASQLPQ